MSADSRKGKRVFGPLNYKFIENNKTVEQNKQDYTRKFTLISCAQAEPMPSLSVAEFIVSNKFVVNA
jgi:hypothetical protein